MTKKYEVLFTQTETFRVIVEAQDEEEADDKASESLSNGDFDEMGDCSIISSNVRELK